MSIANNIHSVVVVGSGNVAESVAVAVADSFALPSFLNFLFT